MNGALTIGENIGDLGGLGIAWKAYQVSLRGQEAPVIDGLTGAQRFFMAWAALWKDKGPGQEDIRCSPPTRTSQRVPLQPVVRNLDEFYSAFDVKATDELWLKPETRVHIR